MYALPILLSVPLKGALAKAEYKPLSFEIQASSGLVPPPLGLSSSGREGILMLEEESPYLSERLFLVRK